MYYRLEKYIIDQFVTFIRRVFRYNSQWVNKDLEIVQFASGSDSLVFEQFFEENEKYPIVVIAGTGGVYSNAGFSDFIVEGDEDSISFGNRSLSYVTISDSNVLAVQVPSDAYNEVLRGMWLSYGSNIAGDSGSDIQVNLFKNYTTTGSIVASASLPGIPYNTFESYFAEFCPYVNLSESDYWIELNTSSGSLYNIGLDTEATTLYKFGNTNYTGSVNGSLVLPAFLRFGGNYEGSITIRCMAKNDTAGARNLSELIAQYVILAKHGQVNRTSSATNGMVNSLVEGVDNEWLKSGFFIKNVRQGALENRPRGENDHIFISTLTIDIFSEWSQDYPVESISDITESDSVFDP